MHESGARGVVDCGDVDVEEPVQRITLEQTPLSCETPLAALAATEVPQDALFVRNHFDVPDLDERDWRLRVHGLVDQVAEFALDDLRALPQQETVCVLECAGNGRTLMAPAPPGTPWTLGGAGGVRVRGVALRTLLRRVGISGEATQLVASGADTGVVGGQVAAFARALPLCLATAPEPLIAWELGGAPLAPEHGAPARLVVPGWYAVNSVKWLTQLELRRGAFDGPFGHPEYTYRGDARMAEGTPTTVLQVRSVIATPEAGERVAPGPISVAGTAWSGTGTIERVTVSTDAGATWRSAQLSVQETRHAPCRWHLSWEPPRTGTHVIVARATDSTGATQPLRSVWNAGGYGNNVAHRVAVTAG